MKVCMYNLTKALKNDKDEIVQLIENELSNREREFLQWDVLKSQIIQDIENENECYVIKQKERT